MALAAPRRTKAKVPTAIVSTVNSLVKVRNGDDDSSIHEMLGCRGGFGKLSRKPLVVVVQLFEGRVAISRTGHNRLRGLDRRDAIILLKIRNLRQVGAHGFTWYCASA